MHRSIAAKQAQIAEICRHFLMRRLEVFGSAARGDDYDPARSDADVLVELDTDSPISQFSAYFALHHGLHAFLGRGVDLVSPSAVEDPLVRASTDRGRELIYES